ncbi:E3 ubiquitin-protein ligase TRIM17 [Nibea albiflora]|uniref:E3 ubiquitin-protein ligase TRIM17 n=1 Tax=Nibea albiflora TaxID=240163 RepID=A0ACB7EY71_NIBAL|nr:E3 ubiquitin-protein ligase TRIM17 [Nibea albiflora]
MASSLEKDLCCPVCHEVFKNPLLLTCGHSVCKDCLRQSQECPVCKTVSSMTRLPSNLVLKNLCEAFLLERDHIASGTLCRLHCEEFTLFCLDDQQPACVVCRDSNKHSNHRFRPIDEAARQRKRLQERLERVKEKLKSFEGVKGKFDQTAEHIKVQADTQRGRLRSSLRSFTSF